MTRTANPATGTETEIAAAGTSTAGLSGKYAYGYTYTPTGKPLSVTLPEIGGLPREKVVTRYNSDGLPESTSGLTWYTSDVTYSPYGEPLRTVSGAQPYRVWTTNFIDPSTGRLQRTVADREVAEHRITDSYYSYDDSGVITSNARQLSDVAGAPWDTQCFTYDVMGELVNAWTSKIEPVDGQGCKAANGTTWGPRKDYATSSGPVADAPDTSADVATPDTSLQSTLAATAPDTKTVVTGATAYRQSFTFDWLGNRAAMTEYNPADATKNVTFKYGYGNAQGKQPHTLGSVTSNPPGQGSSYQYDAVGNTKVRDLSATTQNLTWTQENKPSTITDDGTKTTYVYDANGNRLLENSPSGSTLYLGETEVTTDANGAIVRASRAYAHPGAPTVVRTTNNGATTGHKRNVMLADHLGTANTTVDVTNTAQPITRRASKPYGEIRGPKPTTWPNKRSYLGVGIDDAATGLTHVGAREYDQGAGRFLSADPIIDIADPLQMNGYAYSSNSPISKSDPSGLCPAVDCPTRPDANSENTTPGHVPGKKKDSQNHQAAVSSGNARGVGDDFRRKYQEVYPTVYVDRSWKYANQFGSMLTQTIDNACRDAYGTCLGAEDAEQAEFDRKALAHFKFLACIRLGRESGCLGKVATLGSGMAAVAMMAGGSGEGPGGLGGGGSRPSRNLGDYADSVRNEPGAKFASEYTSPSGAQYYGRNKHGQQAEGELADVLEQTGHHGGCAEVHCLIQAQTAEGPEAIRGGTMRTVRTRNNSMPTSSTTGHGEPAHPCGRCGRLLDELGIG
jgi:RHS repeat-associated protein